VNGDWVPSEIVIRDHISSQGGEYRAETDGPSPVPGLREGEEGHDHPIDYARRLHAAE
jgi:hypothetical protein